MKPTLQFITAALFVAFTNPAVLATETDTAANNSTTNTAESNQQVWFNYDQAVQASKTSGKPIMLVFSGSDWCGWCVRLKNEVFNTNEFQQWAQENVHAVEVDFPRGHALPQAVAQQNQLLKQQYGAHVQSYPTVLFVDSSNQQVIGKAGFVAGGATNWIQQSQAFTATRSTEQISSIQPTKAIATPAMMVSQVVTEAATNDNLPVYKDDNQLAKPDTAFTKK